MTNLDLYHTHKPGPCPVCGYTWTYSCSNGGCNHFSIHCGNCQISLSIGSKWGDEGYLESIENWDNLHKKKAAPNVSSE